MVSAKKVMISEPQLQSSNGFSQHGEIRSFINGRWFESAEHFTTLEPATGTVLSTVALSSVEDVHRAVMSARRAFDDGIWSRLTAGERGAFLLNIADLLEERLEELAELETRDTGLPIVFTQGGHLPRAVAHFRYFAEEAQRVIGEVYPLERAYLNLTVREPVGVVALITPWNAPLSVLSMQLAAALACGNTCVVKPSELAPLTAAILAELATQAELPPGVLNIVYGPADPTGRALVSHPDVDAISFTGGTDAGKEVMESAARGLKRFACELGGKSANIIFSDTDFDRAIDASMLCMFANNGEVCTAGSRILVENSLVERFTDTFVDRVRSLTIGDPLSSETEMGPLISSAQQKKIFEFIETGLDEGAQLLCGSDSLPVGLSRGFYVQPVVFSTANSNMAVAQEEVFGPATTIIPFSDEYEAIEIANNSRYGLAGYVWSGNVERGLRVAQNLRAGAISINAPMVRDIRAPFGGYKQSGLGRAGGNYSIDFYTETKTICLPVHGYQFPRLGTRGSSASHLGQGLSEHSDEGK